MSYTGLVLLFGRLVCDPGIYSLYLRRDGIVVNESVIYWLGEAFSRICSRDRCVVSVPPFIDEDVIDYLYLVTRLMVIDSSITDILDYLIEKGFKPSASFRDGYIRLIGIRPSSFMGPDDRSVIDRGSYVLEYWRASVVEGIVIEVRRTGALDAKKILDDLENALTLYNP